MPVVRPTTQHEIADPVIVYRPDAGESLVLVCEHASRDIPDGWDHLGLLEDELNRHIGWDIGAAEVTRGLADTLDAEAVLCRFSRLFIDCNRRLDAADLIPTCSDGTFIPGNADISNQERTLRIASVYTPFHLAVAATIDRRSSHARLPAVVNVHSFTPKLNGERRPWDIGLMCRDDDRLARALFETLSDGTGLSVGFNQPYSGHDLQSTHTMIRHSEPRGVPHVQIEIRQDHIDETDKVSDLVPILARSLRDAIGTDKVNARRR